MSLQIRLHCLETLIEKTQTYDMGLDKGGNMGLLDFIFGKDPEWVEVTKDTFSIEDTYI